MTAKLRLSEFFPDTVVEAESSTHHAKVIELQLPLTEKVAGSITSPRGESGMKEVPSIELVLEYAKKEIDRAIFKNGAGDLPKEHKEEIKQNAYVRIIEQYENIDPERGWRAYVQTHCRGAVLDYRRSGTGFKESKWVPKKKLEADIADTQDDADLNEDEKAEHDEPEYERVQLRTRANLFDGETGESREVEDIAGAYGIFHQMFDEGIFNPRWDLLARLASHDDDVHLVAKILLGFTQEEQAEDFGVTRERLSQRIRILFDKLKAGRKLTSPFYRQVVFALGLNEYLDMPDEIQLDLHGNPIGYDMPAVDLFSDTSLAELTNFIQPSLPLEHRSNAIH